MSGAAIPQSVQAVEMSWVLHRIQGTELYRGAGEAVLYSAINGNAVSVDPATAVVWTHIDGRRTAAGILHALNPQADTSARLTSIRKVKCAAHNLIQSGMVRSTDAADTPQAADSDWWSTDNGFQCRSTMDDAHRPVVEVAVAILAERGGNVLDLGCGNGVLLRKIHAAAQGVTPFGIEAEPSRLQHARNLLGHFSENFYLGDMFENDCLWPERRRYALAIFTPRRLLEVTTNHAAQLKEKLKKHCDVLIVHAYYGSTELLAERALKCGLVLLDSNTSNASAVNIARFA